MSTNRSLNQLADDYLKRFDGEKEPAIETLVYDLMHDASMLRPVIEDAISYAVRHFVGQHIRAERKQATQGFRRDPRMYVVGMARGKVLDILDTRLPSGIKLRDATHDDLRKAADRMLHQASTMREQGFFFRAMAARLPAGRRVGEVWNEEKVKNIYADALNEAVVTDTSGVTASYHSSSAA
jgi:hypothetical protein